MSNEMTDEQDRVVIENLRYGKINLLIATDIGWSLSATALSLLATAFAVLALLKNFSGLLDVVVDANAQKLPCSAQPSPATAPAESGQTASPGAAWPPRERHASSTESRATSFAAGQPRNFGN